MTKSMNDNEITLFGHKQKLNIICTCIMLIMFVIDILVCPEILLVHYEAASIRLPIYLNCL